MIDLTGKRYGRLVVVGFDRLQNHKTYWKCACDCGLVVVATGNNLRSGNTSSCGCLRRETAKARYTERAMTTERAFTRYGAGCGSGAATQIMRPTIYTVERAFVCVRNGAATRRSRRGRCTMDTRMT